MRKRYVWLLGTIALALAILPLQTSHAQDVGWTDVTDPVLAGNGDGESAGWGDYDNDGDLDLYVTNWGPNRLLRNDGASGFVDVTAAPLDDAGYAKSINWIDYDNDGDLDLFVVNYTQDNRLFENRYPDGFVDATPTALFGPTYDVGSAWTDFDRNGHLDLFVSVFVQSPTSQCMLFAGNGNLFGEPFDDVTPPQMQNVGQYFQAAAWADYDNDGDQDLFVTRFIGANCLYRNDDGVFVDVAQAAGVDLPDAATLAVDWGDYDNDGDLDLAVANWGPNNLLQNRGDGTFEEVAVPAFAIDDNTTSITWFDYDNDADLDLYLASHASNQLLRNDGDGIFVDVSSGAIADPNVCWGAAIGDYDQDGDLDVYLSNGTYGLARVAHLPAPSIGREPPRSTRDVLENRLIRNDCDNGLHWLHLRLVDDSGCISPAGTRVTCWTAGVAQIREVNASTRYWCFDSLDVEFGLGMATVVDSLVIQWPSGAVDVSYDVAVDQGIITAVGDTDGGSVSTLPAMDIGLMCYPNPFNPSTTIAYDLSRPQTVTVRIVTMSGQRVRTLVHRLLVAEGRHTLVWNGCDDAGRSLPTGMYVCRLESEDQAVSRKVLLVK